MSALIYPLFSILVIIYCLRSEPGAIVATVVFAALGAFGVYLDASLTGVILLALALGTAVCGLPGVRRLWLSPKLFAFFKKVAPRVSPTERTALEAGTVGWEGEVFSGRPDWQRLLATPNPGVSEREQAFLDEQCETVCGMCNGWDIAVERADLPPEAWDYLKKEKFFGMIIPEEYGGLGFSAKAQSMVLQKLSSNETLMVVVGVPNSLGPGELLLKYGTDEQKNHYLPRLADGREIPCFGLTGPRAGSDATSIPDTGIVCKGTFEGKEVLGVRLNFEKRWITLAPIATVVGLAFRMFDPDHLLGDTEDIGITCALVPRDTEGMEIGRRHIPVGSPFMNGPIKGKDVFIPLDWLIGGPEMAGQGWRMLVECLSVGRCITLPSGAAGTGRYLTGLAGGFTRVRRQFNLPVADMEGVQAALARIAALGYIARASVLETADTIDNGQKPAVPSAILKSHLTEFQRQIACDAMDVHGGKTVTLGPNNYLGIGFASSAVPITVEGANIMTRSLIVFGQGAIRSHPWVLKEIEAVDADDAAAFDKAIFGHIGTATANIARLLGALIALPPRDVGLEGMEARYVARMDRLSAAFSLLGDLAMGVLGAELKRAEMLSARLGDILSNVYLASLTLKHWHEGPRVEGSEALLRYAMDFLLNRAETAVDEVLQNFPSRPLAVMLRPLVLPPFRRIRAPDDNDARAIARAISTDSALRNHLLDNTWQSQGEGMQDNPLARYNALLKDYERAEALYRKLDKAAAKGKLPMTALHPEQKVSEGAAAGIISDQQRDFMERFEAEVLAMISVDDFPFDALAKDTGKIVWHNEQPAPEKTRKAS